MRNIYIFFISMLTLPSCGTSIDYIGNSYSATKSIDVYLYASAIKQPYEIMGKGFVHHRVGNVRQSAEVVQRKAIEKAKIKGADAIIIQDYLVTTPIGPVVQTDSVGKSITTNVPVKQSGATGFTILFLKYTK